MQVALTVASLLNLSVDGEDTDIVNESSFLCNRSFKMATSSSLPLPSPLGQVRKVVDLYIVRLIIHYIIALFRSPNKEIMNS